MSTELENSFEEEIDLKDELSKLSIHLRLEKEEGGGRIYPHLLSIVGIAFICISIDIDKLSAAAFSLIASARCPLFFPKVVLLLQLKCWNNHFDFELLKTMYTID